MVEYVVSSVDGVGVRTLRQKRRLTGSPITQSGQSVVARTGAHRGERIRCFTRGRTGSERMVGGGEGRGLERGSEGGRRRLGEGNMEWNGEEGKCGFQAIV